VSKVCVTATWDDVPHLSEQDKADMLGSMSPHERDARSKGIPSLGSGVIYPVPEDTYLCDPFALPEYWPKAYGLDVGWNRTAAVWGAWDRGSDIVYLWSEHYVGQAEPQVHADAIRQRGEWIPGAIDPASAGAGQLDGKRVIDAYLSLGLNLYPAENAVEAGIHAVYRRLVSGRLKVFSTLQNWRREARIYRRDENGKIVKENDHLMDATKYLIMTGMAIARIEPEVVEDWGRDPVAGRDPITGY
jgi:hypothetical protein